MREVNSVHDPLPPGSVSIHGCWGEILAGTCREWMLRVSDDLLLSGFRRKPGIQPWIGEHVGKYLLGALAAGRLLDSHELRAKTRNLAEELVGLQEEDGYLGTYARDRRWLGPSSGGGGMPDVWDVWVHKYCMLALVRYHEYTGWEPALEAAAKAADLVLREFGAGGSRDLNESSSHRGLAAGSVLEPIVLLYRHTEEKRYLEFARHVLSRWEAPNGPRLLPVLRERGDVCTIGDGKAYEMMSCFVGLLEYARVTGDRDVLSMVADARDRIADTQRYPTGGMSNLEFFWRPGLLPEWTSMETCVTFTWIQLNLRLFELTGDERALDLVEEASWNQLLPAVSPQHDTWSYHLSMTGPKRFFKSWVHGVDSGATSFGGAPITCCHTNGQRGLTLVPTYSYTVTAEGALAVNLYGESEARVELPGAGPVCVRQQTEFPRSGDLTIQTAPEADGEYKLLLRRPPWASDMLVDDEPVPPEQRRVAVRCSGPVTLRVRLDMTPRVRMCGLEARGKCAVTYGPLVLAMDHAPGGWGLDEVALRLGRGEVTQRLSATTECGWPAVDAPTARISGLAVSDPDAQTGTTVRLRPVILAGLQGNPGLERTISGSDVPSSNLPKEGQTLFPEYRVLLPFFWSPD